MQSLFPIQFIQRALYPAHFFPAYMSVVLCGGNAVMAQQFLYQADIGTRFQQMSGIAVA